jgi:mono/diheme cytochrome c family protein
LRQGQGQRDAFYDSPKRHAFDGVWPKLLPRWRNRTGGGVVSFAFNKPGVIMRSLAVLCVVLIAAIAAGGAYFFGGFYDVAAVGPGNPAVEWAVKKVRQASVRKHATAFPAPSSFNDPKTVQAGAHEFTEEGCVHCHGAPGRNPDSFTRGMNPRPPDLGRASAPDPPSKVFWIVKHGIRMTGMPEFGSHVSDDEIWRLVAFVKRLRQVTPAEYQAWSGGGNASPHQGAPASPAP